MIGKYVVRQFHSGVQCWSAPKSALAALRKKTGYTFANCKKALEMHNNDLTKAESWLKEQAQSLGWSKATKLQGRQTSQGLIGVLIRDNVGAMVEINCETDFVARNEHFQGMIENAANACIQYAKDMESGEPLTKINLNTDQLKELKSSDGKSLADHLALMIGTVGENASLTRALCYKTNNNILLSGYAHPSGGAKSDTLLGRFAALVAVKQQAELEENVDELGKKLCQHIVGMDPKKIGTDKDEPNSNSEDETCLIHQEYLHDDNFTVKEVLQEYQLEVVDFNRFGCGENDGQGKDLEKLETCQ